MSKHTPAPWSIQHKTVVGPGGDQWGPIATVSDSPRFDNKANAQLIACAPELLDQLKAAVFCMKEVERRMREYGNPGFVVKNFEYVDALIAKAEGGGK